MNRATLIRAAEASPPRDRAASDRGAPAGLASLSRVPPDDASYRRFDRPHDTSEATLGKPAACPPESDEAAATPPTPSPDGDDPAFTLRSLLRLHAADLIVTLRQWGERLDTREATLELRAAHLNLLHRRSRATSRPHAEAADDGRTQADPTGPTPPTARTADTGTRTADTGTRTAETGTSDVSIDAAIARGWRDELAAQREAIDRLRHDADRFANRLESSLR